MKSSAIAVSAALFAFGVISANAADLGDHPVSYKDTVYTPPISWAGKYVGGHFGAGFRDDECDYDYQAPTSVPQEAPVEFKKESEKGKNGRDECVHDDDDDTVFIGGIHLGYNWGSQVSYGSVKDGGGYEASPYIYGIEADVSFGDDIDYLASIRGRLGYAFDSSLLYGTAGIAFIGLEDALGDDVDEVGFVIGGGIDNRLSQDWSIGVEGLYYAFDEDEVADEDFWVVRGRISYHLNR